MRKYFWVKYKNICKNYLVCQSFVKIAQKKMTNYVKPNANCDSSRICPVTCSKEQGNRVKHEFPQRSFPEEISAASPKNISAKRSVASNDESASLSDLSQIRLVFKRNSK